MARYSVGVDFGTLSGRALLVNVETGEEIASAAFDYPHAVMDRTLPDGTPLATDWALQHPQDYLDVLAYTVPAILRESGVSAEEVIGIGIDVTASTLLPVRSDGTPLCFLPEYASHSHAYVKLWKHHAGAARADRITEAAERENAPWLARYGRKVSSEWTLPKVWQLLEEAPEIYKAADQFMEAADWIVFCLSGARTYNACCAGYKAFWHKREGFPPRQFYQSLDPRLAGVMEEKFSAPILPIGAKAGKLSARGAALTGLKEGTAVAVANVDAHVCVPAVGIDGPAKMLAIMGTSTCHMLLGTEEKAVDGICGVVEDGILPGFFGYEAGQSCVGDHFAWFIDHCLPQSYREQAGDKNIHVFLREKAEKLRPGESGLLALDWWNGNRSVLVDADLSGLILGMTLQTRPEEIYRALIEATAFGTRKIIEAFRKGGVPVEEFYASGGISQKDPMTMQIYADVINMPIRIAGSAQGPALGSAIFGAVAAGKAAGGYDSVQQAAAVMGKVKETVYTPNCKNAEVYDRLYAEYSTLHDYFGVSNDVMKRLKKIKIEARG